MTHYLDEQTRLAGMALLGKDYANLSDIIYSVHQEPFHGYTRVPKLVMNIIAAFGDSLYLNQAKVLFEIASQIEPCVPNTIKLNTEFFIYNELLSGEIYAGLEYMLDFLMTDKYGLYLSHRALAAVMMKHEGLELQYGLIPSQQDAKDFIIKTVNTDLPSKIVEKAIERYDELSSSMYYDYLQNLRHALMNCTAYDLFKDMPRQILDHALSAKVRDDVCVLWIDDLIEILDYDKDSAKPVYTSHEEEMIATSYKTVPPLILYVLDGTETFEYKYSINIKVAYRLGMITLHPLLTPWFEELKQL